MKIFLSYAFADEEFVRFVNFFLRQQGDVETFCYVDDEKAVRWTEVDVPALKAADAFVLFVGKALGSTQSEEFLVGTACDLRMVVLLGDTEADKQLNPVYISGLLKERVADTSEVSAVKC